MHSKTKFSNLPDILSKYESFRTTSSNITDNVYNVDEDTINHDLKNKK